MKQSCGKSKGFKFGKIAGACLLGWVAMGSISTASTGNVPSNWTADERNQLPVDSDSQSYNDPANQLMQAEISESIRKISTLSPHAREVQVSVSGGTIVLEGTADSVLEREKIMACAKEVAGMTAVENRVTIWEEK